MRSGTKKVISILIASTVVAVAITLSVSRQGPSAKTFDYKTYESAWRLRVNGLLLGRQSSASSCWTLGANAENLPGFGFVGSYCWTFIPGHQFNFRFIKITPAGEQQLLYMPEAEDWKLQHGYCVIHLSGHNLTGVQAMRVVVNEFISLDGVVQAPGGPDEDGDGGFRHGGWSMPYFDVRVMGSAIAEQMSSTEALLFGRCTWQKMADAGPERASDPYADQMNAIKKYVVSNTLSDNDMAWNYSTRMSSLADVAHLRGERGGDLLVWGSSRLVTALLATGQVDELNLMIEPIVLGGGKRIFPDDTVARPMELVRSVTSDTGVLVCTYRPADSRS